VKDKYILKHLKAYSENFTYKEINYEYEWTMPNSVVRKELQLDLNDILLEAKDIGYGVSTSWVKIPYVWIGVKLFRKGSLDDALDTIERVKDYLVSKGFKILEDKLNTQIYIYFDYEEPKIL